MAIRDFSNMISANLDVLTPQTRKAATYLLANPEDVAVLSMRDVAKKADVTPATLVRLAQSLHLAGYGEVKDHFVESLRVGDMSSYSAKARQMQDRSDSGGGGSQGALIDERMDILAQVVSANGPEQIDAFARGVLDSRNVYVFGSRSSFGPMYQYYYLFRLFRQNVVLVSDPSGAQGDMLRWMGQGDAFLLASFSPYAQESVRTAQSARKAGATVFAVTDSRVSPIAASANEILTVSTSTSSFFPSLVGFIAILEVVLARQVILGGTSAVEQIEAAERQLAALGAYWDEGKRR